MRTHTHIHTYIHTQADIHIHTHTQTHTHIYTHTNTQTYTHAHIHTHIHTHRRMCDYTDTCVQIHSLTLTVISFDVETISVLENAQRKTTSNYAGGDKVGQSWTDKVMGFKSSSSMDDKQKQPLPHELVEGVDEDEWVSDDYTASVCVFVCMHVCVCVYAFVYLLVYFVHAFMLSRVCTCWRMVPFIYTVIQNYLRNLACSVLCEV